MEFAKPVIGTKVPAPACFCDSVKNSEHGQYCRQGDKHQRYDGTCVVLGYGIAYTQRKNTLSDSTDESARQKGFYHIYTFG